MAGEQSSFVWYELMTIDVAAAKAFYAGVVGWNTQDVPMPGMTYTLLLAGGAQIGGLMALPKEARDAGMTPTWAGYIGVGDADEAAAKAQRLGGAILGPPVDISGVGRFATVTDPQGALFNLFRPAVGGVRVVSSEPGHVGWHELHTRDWAKAFEFYADMFGWLKGEALDMGPLGTYQIFKIGGLAMGGMFNSPGAQATQFWLYYFNVEDIDAASRRVTDGGGKIAHGPNQVPGGNWILQAVDPQGAAFALLGPRK
ncbi:MAG: VOC family protein [Gammaproteobacteria bacterium]